MKLNSKRPEDPKDLRNDEQLQRWRQIEWKVHRLKTEKRKRSRISQETLKRIQRGYY